MNKLEEYLTRKYFAAPLDSLREKFWLKSLTLSWSWGRINPLFKGIIVGWFISLLIIVIAIVVTS